MQPETAIRPKRPTLRVAAEELRRIGSHPEAMDWTAEALPAVRAAIVAVEGELDALYARDTSGETVAQAEPRLIHAVEELQAHLAKELVTLWEMKEAPAATMDPAHVAQAAARLLDLAERSLALVYEALRRTDALD